MKLVFQAFVQTSLSRIFSYFTLKDDVSAARALADKLKESEGKKTWLSLYCSLLFRHGFYSEVVELIPKTDSVPFNQKMLLFSSWARIGTQEAYEVSVALY